MKTKLPGGVYPVADVDFIGAEKFLHSIERALEGGAKILQMRWKKYSSDREFFKLAERAEMICKKRGVLFIINDRFDIALCSGADGVHLGEDDLPPLKVREKAGEKFIIGFSAHSIEDIEKMDEEKSVDYLSFGSVFPTSTKREGRVIVQGLEKLKEAVKRTKIPLYAIGGISKSNLRKIKETGVFGFCCISAIFEGDPLENLNSLNSIWNEKKN